MDTEAFQSATRLSFRRGGDREPNPLARLEGACGLKSPTLSSHPNRCDIAMTTHSDQVTNFHDREEFPSKSLKRKHIFSNMTKNYFSRLFGKLINPAGCRDFKF